MFGLAKVAHTLTTLLGKNSKPKDVEKKGWTFVDGAYDGNLWQSGTEVYKNGRISNPGVEACVGQISRAIGMFPVYHYKDLPDGGKEKIKNSKVTRLLRKPNNLQHRADFMNNLVRSVLFEGNGYAVTSRNSNFEIVALQLVSYKDTNHYKDQETGDIYYYVGSQDRTHESYLVPQRDMLNIRMATTSDPLKGVTPLYAALNSVATSTSIQANNASFFSNQSKPSGTLQTDMELDSTEVDALRARWQKVSQGKNQGQVPILSHGLEWKPLSVNAVDSELVAMYNLSLADIARIFGIPSALINLDSENSTFANVESLLNMWVSTGLASIVDSIELSLEDLFELPEDEHINFDLDYMLRGNLKDRMDALASGISGGVLTINEARSKSGLRRVSDGDEIRLQMQNVPLDYYKDKLSMDQEKIDQEQQKIDNDKEAQDNEPMPESEEDEDVEKLAIEAITKAMNAD